MPRRGRSATAPRCDGHAALRAYVDRERHLRRNHARELQSLAWRRCRHPVIQHELADDSVEADEGNERQRGDPFGREGRHIRRQ